MPCSQNPLLADKVSPPPVAFTVVLSPIPQEVSQVRTPPDAYHAAGARKVVFRSNTASPEIAKWAPTV
jgi:hypothetical protein